MKKVLSIILSICLISGTLGLTAVADSIGVSVNCANFASCGIINGFTPLKMFLDILGASFSKSNDSGITQSVLDEPDAICVCLGSEPDTLDPALCSWLDSMTLVGNLFAGLAKWDKDGVTIVPDCAERLPEGVVNEDGTITYTYTLRENLKWSDGKPLTAYDFEYAWKRAASTYLCADYAYMFSDIKGYPNNLSVKSLDDRTLRVTLINDVPYWNEILAFTTFMPVREDVTDDYSWSNDLKTFVCNGPYKLSKWKHDNMLTLEKNEYYHNVDEVTMKKINCILSDDDAECYELFKAGKLDVIENVPVNEISKLKTSDEFYTQGQMGTYFLCWNVNENLLPENSALTGKKREEAQEEIRKAFSLLIDRNYIVESITGCGEVAAWSLVAMNIMDTDKSAFGKKYIDVDSVDENYYQAVEMLKKYYTFDEATGKFTDIPSVGYMYNTSATHSAIGEYVQFVMSTVGAEVSLENVEWNTFLNMRSQGQFALSRHGWVADYNDPVTFLEMWTTDSYNNDAQFGKGEHAYTKAYSLDLSEYGYEIVVQNGDWEDTYDVLIDVIKNCKDKKTRYKLMHLAEDMIMDTGCIVPIYYYTDVYMIDSNVKGIYTSPLGLKYFMECNRLG